MFQEKQYKRNEDSIHEFWHFKSSWFIESTHVYSPYILVQLISFMVFLACNVFQIDLVIDPWSVTCDDDFPTIQFNFVKFSTFSTHFARFIGDETRWSQYHDGATNGNNYGRHTVLLLLLCRIGYEQLSTNGRLLVRMQLVRSARWFAKIVHFYDSKHSSTDLLSRIWCCLSEFGNIHEGKQG